MRCRLLSVAVLLALSAVAFGAEPKAWWAFEPVARPKVPDRAHPVDHFVRAKLAEKGLSLSPEADRRTLVRRVTFDLTGLPPTPEEVDAFVTDKDANAYEKLVDRLLASPAYGERFARLWMDAVHFAETHGHDQDRVRPNAWPYRDYLISAFNADTPYARFVKEQIAADVLFPNEPKLVPALGFLAAGPWDESSLRDIREDTIDREIARYLDRDDIVTTVMTTFAGMTVQCARCHDHKFDPIPQEEYYRLQAVFAGVGRGEVPFELDADASKKRKELQALLASIAKNDPAVKVESPDLLKAVSEFEKRHTGAGTAWTVPLFTKIASDGSTLTKQKDDSILSDGKRPEKDTYTLVTRVKGKRVTAVRLELLTDDTLPHRGPGRQDNGNLHLSEFTVTAAGKAVKIRTASADFDQASWTVLHAIDGNRTTAWGIYPQVGKPHEAVFEFAEAVGGDGETELTFALEQLHGGGHLIGRFRLSLTDAAPPLKALVVPPALRAILTTPAAKRTEAQTRELALHVLKEQTTAELAALPAPAMVYAAAPNFTIDGSHRPVPMPREVRMLKRGDIRKPGAAVEPGALDTPSETAGRVQPEGHQHRGRPPRRARGLAHRREQPAHLAGDGEPRVAVALRRGPRRHGERLRQDGPVAHAPGVARLPRGRTASAPIAEESAPAHRDERDLQASEQGGSAGLKADEDNKLLWRQNRTRLDAEQLRDAILAISGRLDRTAGGPSDRQFDLKPGIHVTPMVDYGKFDWDRKEGHRRSVYRFVFRTLPDPLVECLDGADASALTPKRSESVTAPQALALLNNEFVLVHAKAMAARLEKHSAERAKQIEFACRLVWGRAPSADEAKLFAAYADKHGLPNLCRVLFNTNEFLFAD